jgi:hypothetical protein
MSILEWFSGLAFFTLSVVCLIYGGFMAADFLRFRLRAQRHSG